MCNAVTVTCIVDEAAAVLAWRDRHRHVYGDDKMALTKGSTQRQPYAVRLDTRLMTASCTLWMALHGAPHTFPKRRTLPQRVLGMPLRAVEAIGY